MKDINWDYHIQWVLGAIVTTIIIKFVIMPLLPWNVNLGCSRDLAQTEFVSCAAKACKAYCASIEYDAYEFDGHDELQCSCKGHGYLDYGDTK